VRGGRLHFWLWRPLTLTLSPLAGRGKRERGIRDLFTRAERL